MDKVDFKQELRHLYNPKNTDWELVEVPTMNFLMIDGQGNPNTSKGYRDAVQALYGLAYTIKLMSRRKLDRDYVVPPLEGLWSADDPATFVNADKDKYQWTMMIMQPDWITQARVSRAVDEAAKKQLPGLSEVRF